MERKMSLLHGGGRDNRMDPEEIVKERERQQRRLERGSILPWEQDITTPTK